MTKTRLAPMKTISLSRLELNAAVLGVRLCKMIIKEIDLLIQTIKSGLIQHWYCSTLGTKHIVLKYTLIHGIKAIQLLTSTKLMQT